MRHLFPILWSQLGWLLCLAAADAAPLFDDAAVIDIELRGPINETLRDTRDREERPFVLTVEDTEFSTMVSVRGNSRVVYCSFPPLRLRFNDVADTVFAGQGKLKLVTHCNKASSYELNVLEEYAAYRIMALLTDSAIRVRLLHIRYVDTDKPGKDPLERFGFVLETEEDMAARIGGTRVELDGVIPSRLAREQLAAVFVTQYLIGNADYSLVTATGDDSCCHNGILIEVDNQLHYVPYDFDLASLVNARYAKSAAGSGRRARARRYVGYCFEGLDLEAAILRVRDAREDVFAEIRAVEAISGRELKHARRFLEEFYREAEDVERLVARFEKSCLG